MGHTRIVFERLLNRLERRSKVKHFLQRFARRDLYLVVGFLSDITARGQVPKTARHLCESIVHLDKMTRHRIDQCDAARNVGEDFLTEHDFPLNAPRRFHLAPVEFAPQPGKHRRQRDQPRGEESHSLKQIVHRFIGDGLRLFHNGEPAGRFDRTEGIKIPLPLEMPALALADLFHQKPAFGRNGSGVRLRSFRKNGGAVLIDHFAKRLVSEFNGGQTASHSFHKH